jgi:hypothetical protein
VRQRGDAYGPEVLYVLGGLVAIILLSLWFTGGPGDPKTVDDCVKQHGSIEVSRNGTIWCWLTGSETAADPYRVRLTERG